MLWEHVPKVSVSLFFRVFPIFQECFYDSIGTRRKKRRKRGNNLLDNKINKFPKRPKAVFIVRYSAYTTHVKSRKNFETYSQACNFSVEPVLSGPQIKRTHPLLSGHQLKSRNFLPIFTVN